jgi:glycosyltransferase involved in cell wall biosynthesis
VELVFVGDGPDRGMLEQLVRETGVDGAVEFLGSCTQPEVADALAAADVLAAPSVATADGRREGIPVALMEGMACGLPVVASALSGIPELVVDGINGLLVEPGNVEALAAALASLSRDPSLRARLGATARRTVAAEFDIERSGAMLAELFRSRIAHGVRPEGARA